jgi:tetratricopeptide (TPR) repeat protein
MAGNQRIEELRRRVQSDPASIAFAALAEEYRRAGQFEAAIATCRTGLRRHPAYVSAHVTLGRALIEVGQYEEARQELEYVLKIAPENLAAIRALADIHHRAGGDAARPEAASEPPRKVSPIAPAPAAAQPPPVAAAPSAPPPGAVDSSTSASAAPDVSIASAVPAHSASALDETRSIPLTPAEPAPLPEPPSLPRAVEAEQPAPIVVHEPPAPDPALAGLEVFLAAILREREALDRSATDARS